MSIGLSTTLGPTGQLSPEALLDRVLRAGAAGLLLAGSLPPGYLAELVPRLSARRDELPVWAVESPCPATARAVPELGSIERDESRAALELGEQTVRLAGELGEGAMVLLRLGEVSGARHLWPPARKAFLRDELAGSALAERLGRERDAHAPRHLDGLRRSLERLARTAESAGVRIGVRNPSRFIGLPSPIELRMLFEELAGAAIAPALDLAAAHLGDAMSLRPIADVLAAWKSSELVLAADACGPIAGLPPGRGEIDLKAAFADLAGTARVVFTPAATLDEAEVIDGMSALRALRLRA